MRLRPPHQRFGLALLACALVARSLVATACGVGDLCAGQAVAGHDLAGVLASGIVSSELRGAGVEVAAGDIDLHIDDAGDQDPAGSGCHCDCSHGNSLPASTLVAAPAPRLDIWISLDPSLPDHPQRRRDLRPPIA